jgi:NAD(P)-dependent dehydrogenase (short-subunit alcohol dehydrogenase family)
MHSSEVALVTGGGSGIGRATCELLARNGMVVIVADLASHSAEVVDEAISSAGGRSEALPLDITDRHATALSVARILEDHGRIDVLVNAAGVAGVGSALNLDIEEWSRVIDVNLTGTFIVSQAVGRVMAAQKAGGRIINVASVAGLVGAAGMSHYCASKHAVIGLTKSLALEWAPYGIRVNCVCPGATDTPLLRQNSDPARLGKAIPLARLGEPLEQANVIAFLASPHSSYMTGTVLCVDGGVMALNPSSSRSAEERLAETVPRGEWSRLEGSPAIDEEV